MRASLPPKIHSSQAPPWICALPSSPDKAFRARAEFKNPTAYAAREALFASMRKQRHQFNTQGVIKFGRPEDLYEALNTRVFQDYSDMDNVRFQELSKK